jgi:hypothetical protein
MGNDFTVDLIVRESAGEEIGDRAEVFNDSYLRLYGAFLRLYEGQYPIMGNGQVMTCKIAWDNGCYWSVTALLFYQNRLRDIAFMASISGLLNRFALLHARMQQFLRAWHDADQQLYPPGFASVIALARLRQLQAELGDPPLDGDALHERLRANVAWLERFAAGIRALAVERAPHAGLDRAVADGARNAVDLEALRLTPH